MVAEGAAELRIAGAQVAQPVMWQRLILRLFRQRVFNAVCQPAELAEQQGEDEQQADGQGAMHGRYFSRNGYSLSSLSDEVKVQVRVIVRMSVSLVMFAGSGE